jgi:hypothetical protein
MVIHFLKIQGLMMVSTPSFLIPLHAHIDPSTIGMGGNQNHHNQHYVHNDDPFAKVKFFIPPFNGSYDAEAYLDWEMTVEQKFSSHLVPE